MIRKDVEAAINGYYRPIVGFPCLLGVVYPFPVSLSDIKDIEPNTVVKIPEQCLK